MRAVELQDADLSVAFLSEADLRGATLVQANLSVACLRRADFRGASLEGAELFNAFLSGAKLSGAILVGAKLDLALLENADLRAADLSHSLLTYANLTGADLRGACLYDSDLSQAKLMGADLRGADLSRTKLDRANLEGSVLDGAKILTGEAKSLDAVNNQGVVINPNFRLYTWQMLRFRSKTEIKIAQALEHAGVLFLPNCLARLDDPKQTGGRGNKEVDFLVCYQGNWGIIEVDGPYHTPIRRVDEQERERLFRRYGIRSYERFDATRCYEHPDEVVKEFLEMMEVMNS